MTHYVAIDIGGTNIKYGLIDQEGQLVESHEMPTEAHKGGPHILQKKTKDIVASYLKKRPSSRCCHFFGRMVDPDKGEIFYAGPQIPNYAGTQFKGIETSFAIPCEIENDVNCAGLAEAVSGSGKGASVTLCLTIGTGIGGCLIMNGKVFHGFSNSACEVGYMHMQDGAFQDLASTTALVEYVATAHGDPVDQWNGRRIFKKLPKETRSVWLGLTAW